MAKDKTSDTLKIDPTTAADAPAAAPAPAPAAAQQTLTVDDNHIVASYANFCRVSSTPEELILDLGLNPNPFAQGSVTINVGQRIIMNHFTAKRLLQALAVTLQRHEQAFCFLTESEDVRVGRSKGGHLDLPDTMHVQRRFDPPHRRHRRESQTLVDQKANLTHAGVPDRRAVTSRAKSGEPDSRCRSRAESARKDQRSRYRSTTELWPR